MRVLVIGEGGREAALAWAFRQHGHDVALAGDLGDASPAEFDLVVPGPEAALAAGVADECARRGLPCFGPTAALARLESSKSFARSLATELGIPGPRFARIHRPIRRNCLVAGTRFGRRGQARWAGRRQGRGRPGRRGRNRDRDRLRSSPRAVPAGRTYARSGVLTHGALRRHDRRRAAARPGPQADRRRRHGTQHRRDGRLRTCTRSVHLRRARRDVRATGG